jgi:hypothetical protein
LLPGIFVQAILAHRETIGSDGNDQEIRALKAAELLPYIPRFQSEEPETGQCAFDFVRTRSFLWEALVEGLVTGVMYSSNCDPVVAAALLKRVPLSDAERKALKDILRVGFEKHAKSHHIAAQSQILAQATVDDELDVIRAALQSIARHGQGYDLIRLARVYKAD